MELMKLNFNDNELSGFARILALPVRVFIIRTIIENGFTVNRETLHTSSFNAETVNKHVSELRSLGLIKVKGAKGNITYSIEQNWFKQMSVKFSVLFESINRLSPKPIELNTKQPEAIIPSPPNNKPADALPNFGAYIKKHRIELRLSQEELAKKISIDRAQLSRIESGKNILNPDKLKILSIALHSNYDAVCKEYYYFRVTELMEESGYKEVILNRAKEKLNNPL